MVIDWRPRAAHLADALRSAGVLTDPQWAEAVRSVPRHVFVPRFHEQRADGSGWDVVSGLGDPARWLDSVYSDQALVTKVRSTPGVLDGYPLPVSSSTLPSLMLRMLHALDVEDGQDVVEIGTGSGYNAALLCERLGDRHVTSADVDAELVDLARDRLRSVGERPELRHADADGWEPPAFDRLIATCGALRVAPGWLRAARPQALLMVPLTGPLADGGLIRLVADGAGNAEGRFAPFYAGFMAQRRETVEPTTVPQPSAPAHEQRTSPVDPSLLAASEPLAMIAQLRLPMMQPRLWTRTGDGRPVTVLRGVDGSWVEAEHRDPGASIRAGGATDLWSIVEQAHGWWVGADRPGWPRFGLTVTQHSQTLWLDAPHHVLAR